jgi:two-component system phosphate regulon response regulator PhoB
MVQQSVLVVEDEEDIRELIGYNLLKAGYQVAAVASGEEALKAVQSKTPDLILLDIMLPGSLDGLKLCRRFKETEEFKSIPIIILTAKGEEPDIVTGLNMGADDNVTKPFSPKVLLARIEAVLRRAEITHDAGPKEEEEGEIVRIRDLLIHPDRHEVSVGGKRVELTATEFKLLHLLAQRPGRVFVRQRILDGLHGENYAITDRAVDVQIVGLRKKLGPAGSCIETVRGVGYRFKE